ncbi:1-phosphofructokinase family hexose kinase [Streptomyces aureus]|uniref:1-phosphofructokinase family hexose kinase n=1 Tax=Streptomyces aureus TaxID=193461 RepID=UPI0033E4F3A5
MIVTVTANPALDVTYDLTSVRIHDGNQVTAVHEQAGGKGVNVARMLHGLGCPTTAVLPLSGRNGTAISNDLKRCGIPYLAVPVHGSQSRRTVALADRQDVTLFSEPGPRYNRGVWNRLRKTVSETLPKADVLVLAGSLPAGGPTDFYASLIRLARDGGVPVILDTRGPALVAALGERPTIVKPNATELAEAASVTDPRAGAQALRAAGARSVVASLGPDGLLALTPDGSWRARLNPLGRVRGNATGAGDAVVTALALALRSRASWPVALTKAVALSAAAVRAPVAGRFDSAAYLAYLDNVHVTALTPSPG